MEKCEYLLERKLIKVAAILVVLAIVYKAGHALGEFIYYAGH